MKFITTGFFALLFFASLSFANTSQQKLTVLLDSKPNITHVPIIIAQQQGFFKEAGLDVQLVYPKSNISSLIAENQADLGLAYEPKFIEQVDHGLPIIRIGTLIDKPLNCVVALKQSGIKSLGDLKGKEVGSNNNKLSAAIFNSMLNHQGLSAKDIKIVPVQQSATQALLSNKVEAVSGTLRNLDIPQLENNGQKLVVFFPEEHGVPNFSEVLFIANTEHAKDKRFPRFLTAIKKAVRYLDEHPQQAWSQFTKQYPSMNTALNREYWLATMPYFAEDPAEFNQDEWKHFAEFMLHNKLITKTQPISRYTTNIG